MAWNMLLNCQRVEGQATSTSRQLPDAIRRAALATRTVAVTLRAAYLQVRDSATLTDGDRRQRVGQLLAWVEPVSASRIAELAALRDQANRAMTDGVVAAEDRDELEAALSEGRRREQELAEAVEELGGLRDALGANTT